MRTIEWASAFKRDYKRTKAGQRYLNIDKLLAEVVERLANDKPLPRKNQDHALSGEWASLRECHVRPDLLLIYERFEGSLRLVRLGSHCELFRK